MTKREQKVNEKVLLLGKFYEEYCREPKQRETYLGVQIGRFLHNIRIEQIKINEKHRKYLTGLGIKLNSVSQKEMVHEKVIQLGNFYKEYGREPRQRENYNGIKIGNFLSSVRLGNTTISDEDRMYLKDLGIRLTFKIRKEKVHEKILMLGRFYKEYGREPKAKEEYNGIKIGSFFANILTKNTTISEEDRKYLEDLGIKLTFERRKNKVHKKVLALGKFYEEFNRTPRINEEYKEIKIGCFYYNIRNCNTSITTEDRTYLQNLGINL